MTKSYLTANQLMHDSFQLAHQVYCSGFHPEVIIALWRGGTPVGCVLHEYLRFRGVECNHTAVKVSSYTGIGTYGDAVIENIEAVRAIIAPGARLLVVDDIFDSGRTAEAVHAALSPLTATIRFAMPYYKPCNNTTRLVPDYFVHQTDSWLVFPHELDGLTPEEIQQKDPFIASLCATSSIPSSSR